MCEILQENPVVSISVFQKTSLFSHDVPKSKTAISSPYYGLHGSSSTGADFLQFQPKWRRNMLRQRSGMFQIHLILLKWDRKLSLDPPHSGPVYARKMGVNYTTLMHRKIVDLAKVRVTMASSTWLEKSSWTRQRISYLSMAIYASRWRLWHANQRSHIGNVQITLYTLYIFDSRSLENTKNLHPWVKKLNVEPWQREI